MIAQLDVTCPCEYTEITTFEAVVDSLAYFIKCV